MLLLLASLAISDPAAPAAEPPPAADSGPGELERTAPDVTPWPAGLPDPTVTAHGTLLPPTLADAVLRRLLELDAYPARCQARIDAWARIADARSAAVARCSTAQCVVGQEASGWPTWAVVASGTAGLLLGTIVVGWVVSWGGR